MDKTEMTCKMRCELILSKHVLYGVEGEAEPERSQTIADRGQLYEKTRTYRAHAD